MRQVPVLPRVGCCSLSGDVDIDWRQMAAERDDKRLLQARWRRHSSSCGTGSSLTDSSASQDCSSRLRCGCSSEGFESQCLHEAAGARVNNCGHRRTKWRRSGQSLKQCMQKRVVSDVAVSIKCYRQATHNDSSSRTAGRPCALGCEGGVAGFPPFASTAHQVAAAAAAPSPKASVRAGAAADAVATIIWRNLLAVSAAERLGQSGNKSRGILNAESHAVVLVQLPPQALVHVTKRMCQRHEAVRFGRFPQSRLNKAKEQGGYQIEDQQRDQAVESDKEQAGARERQATLLAVWNRLSHGHEAGCCVCCTDDGTGDRSGNTSGRNAGSRTDGKPVCISPVHGEHAGGIEVGVSALEIVHRLGAAHVKADESEHHVKIKETGATAEQICRAQAE